MRLINVHTLVMEDFSVREKPPYAILSHTWGNVKDEVSFADFQDPSISRKKPGFKKIQLMITYMKAKAAEINHMWVDTCCIDKSSSTELSYAINSMFQWYSKARICYVYLSDVHLSDEHLPADKDSGAVNDKTPGAFELLRNKRWFSRGWTLQELLAPENVVFFDANWRKIGDKASCRNAISSITGIEAWILEKAYTFRLRTLLDTSSTPILLWSTGMRWSSKRNTSRPEDTAYCLMGIFDVHMPLLYGEGQRIAFRRLQDEMVKRTSSNSLLTWGLDLSLRIGENIDPNIIFPQTLTPLPILADSPCQFADTPVLGTLHIFKKQASDYKAWVVSNRGIELEMLLITNEAWFRDDPIGDDGIQKRHELAIAVLPFRLSSRVIEYIGFLLSGNSEECMYNRISTPNGTATVKISGRLAAQASSQVICLSDVQAYREHRTPSARSKIIYLESTEFQVQDVLLSRCDWNWDDRSLMFQPDIPGDFQEALVKIVSNKRPKSIFYLLLSNSIVRRHEMPSPQPQSKHWHFRKPGITVVQNDLAERLLNDNNSLPQRVLEVDIKKLMIKTADGSVQVTLRENEVYWDLIYFLNITGIDETGS